MQTSRFDLSVMMSEDEGEIEGSVEYRTDLFDRETIVRFFEMFQRLLEQIVEAPDRRIADFQLVSDEEMATLLGDWSGTATPYPSGRNISQLFRNMAAQRPDGLALVNGEQRITYGDLEGWSNRLAHRLIAVGVRPGAVVAISAERRPALIAGLLAILKAGGAYLALDGSLPVHRIRLMLEDAGVSVCLVQGGSSLATALEEGSVVELAEDGANLEDPPNPPDVGPIPPDGLAYISYTSGSTGQPKGVCVPHRAVVRLVKNTDYAHFGLDERFLQLANVAFDASTFEIWGCLLNGGTLVQAPIATPTLSELATVIEDAKITTLWLTAGLFHQMVDHELTCFRNVRQVLAGGDVLSPNHVRRFIESVPNCRLINGYGPTENTTFTTAYAVEEGSSFASSVPIGRPIANTRVFILDKRLKPVPVGVAGELYAAGDGLALGYLDRPELTAERFVPNPYDPGAGARMYRTGDRARFLHDGLIEFLGRADDEVKIRGFRVEPGEVEAILNEHPDLKQAAVVAGRDAQGATTLIAYMVPRRGAVSLSSRDARSFLEAQLPSYMIPVKFVSLDRIPLTKNGKVDREELQSTAKMEREEEGAAVPPRTPVEQILGDIWCDLLGINAISIDDDFFQLGGHSLLATKLVHRISEEIQEDLPLSAVFQNPTIRALALQITERMLAAVSENKSEGLGVP
jgi:aspartate racemase